LLGWLSALGSTGSIGRGISNLLSPPAGSQHTGVWRLDPNWNFIIIGGVILIAVILDQVAHMVQANRRTRKVSDAAPPQQPSTATAVPVG
jgi:predicted ABC-type sugar transport system permease subunit